MDWTGDVLKSLDPILHKPEAGFAGRNTPPPPHTHKPRVCVCLASGQCFDWVRGTGENGKLMQQEQITIQYNFIVLVGEIRSS